MLFSKPDPIKHVVAGQERNFYPITVSTLLQLRGAAKPLVRAMSVLFGGDDDLVKKEIQEKTSKSLESYEKRTCIDAVSPELAGQRQKARMAAAEDLLEGLTSEASSRLFALVIVDSMRDDFDKKPTTAKEFDDILSSITADALVEILGGIGAANRKLFGPLMNRAAQFGTVLKSKLDGLGEDQPEEPQPE